MNTMFKGVIEYLLHGNYKLSTRKKKLRSKKANQTFIAKNDFFIEPVMNELKSLPLHILPEHDELLAYAKLFFNDMLNHPRKRQFKCPDDSVIEILYQKQMRRSIEILTILNYSLNRIFDLLIKNNLINENDDPDIIRKYQQYFWNYRDMYDTERNLFFSKVIGTDFYALHAKLYYKEISEDLAFATVGLDPEGFRIASHLRRLLCMIVERINNAIIANDPKSTAHWSHAMKSIAELCAQFGADHQENLMAFFYALHAKLYYNEISEDLAFATVGLDPEGFRIASHLRRLLCMIVERTNNAIIANDPQSTLHWSHAMKSIAELCAQFGADHEENLMAFFGDYIEIDYPEFTHKTVEEIEEANAEIDRQQEEMKKLKAAQ